jgi:hypothetical protein
MLLVCFSQKLPLALHFIDPATILKENFVERSLTAVKSFSKWYKNQRLGRENKITESAPRI